MPVDVEPPELAQLLDYAERPRTNDWTLRSALVRYAQPEPARVGAILELVRRIEWNLHGATKVLARDGHALWDGLATGAGAEGLLLEVLRAAQELDQLGEVLAAWAVDRSGERPDAAVDATIAAVTRRLDDAGAPREERVRPPRSG